MATFVLRTIDPDLWARVKARNAREGITLRQLFLRLFEDYADGTISPAAPSDDGKDR